MAPAERIDRPTLGIGKLPVNTHNYTYIYVYIRIYTCRAFYDEGFVFCASSFIANGYSVSWVTSSTPRLSGDGSSGGLRKLFHNLAVGRELSCRLDDGECWLKP